MNNPVMTPEAIWDMLKRVGATGLWMQTEKGAEKGTTHYQGYAEFGIQKRRTTLEKLSPMFHWEDRRGTAQQARDYCTLEEYDGESKGRIAGPWSWGELQNPEPQPGRRTDLDDAIVLLREEGLPAVAEQYPRTFIHAYRGMRELLAIGLESHPNRRMEREVYLHWGPSNTWKTSVAMDAHPVAEIVKFVDYKNGYLNYNGQPNVLFDEFNEWPKKFGPYMEALMDRHATHARCLYQMVPWCAKRIYFTANVHPVHWNMPDDRWAPFKRRVTVVRVFTGPGEYMEIKKEDDKWEQFWNGPPVFFDKNDPDPYYKFLN